jgi:hypothetical protein
MDDYVCKPIDASQFIATVRRWIPCDVGTGEPERVSRQTG